MRRIGCAVLLLWLWSGVSHAAVLTWEAPTTNADLTPLTDLSHHLVYYAPLGQAYGTPLKVASGTSASVGNLTPGVTYRFQASAVDTSQNESALSAPVEYTVPADTTPPTVGSPSIPDGATHVDPNITLTATFSEAMNPASITTQTVRLLDSQGTPVPAAVSYHTSTRQVTLNPTAALAANTVYTWVIEGVTDAAGNPLAPTSIDFTTASAPDWQCPCSVWSLADVPVQVADPDTAAVELGMKFRAVVAGQITGVRYYKSTQNTGTHRGRLWTRRGHLLASKIFPSSENTGQGWKTVLFETPVAIQANTTYIVSYHAPAGRYAADAQYFAQARVHGPLIALRSGVDGGNGVYRYGSGGFPRHTYDMSSYFVDILFIPNPS